MTSDKNLAELARAAGVISKFTDMQGVVRKINPETQRALLGAQGIAAGTAAEVRESLAVIESTALHAALPPDVILQPGTTARVDTAQPADWVVLAEEDERVLAEGVAENALFLPPLPDGVHLLRITTSAGVQKVNLIVAPSCAPSLRDVAGQEKIWGCVAALYGLTTDPGKTLGDYGDLAELASVFGASGAGFLGINPVHALGCAARDVISPYSPTHRAFLNTNHIAPPASLPVDAVDPTKLLDYAHHRASHGVAMHKSFAEFKARAAPAEQKEFDQFCAAGDQRLDDFALFEHLSTTQGPDWRNWPVDLQTAHAARRKVSPEARLFHKWLQWQADCQLARAQNTARGAGMPLGLYLDLAVGARIGGAESWGDAAATAPGVSLGAPPDHLSPAGQNWQLSALAPRKLQASRYDAFRHVLRQNMRHCGLLRIDHALGLHRSYWIPDDGSPGGYVRQPLQALMAIVALEARRAGTVIVGEDLGLVPAQFRAQMAAHGLYGYSVMQYEKDKNGCYLPTTKLRAQSLACFGTHDTPTLAGFWTGQDIIWWEKLGWITAQDATRATDARASEKRQLAGIAPPNPLPQKATAGLRDTIHTKLASSPASLVAVQLDDVLLSEPAQNLPGTIDEHPNWRRRYPLTVTEITGSEDLKKTAGIMAKAGRAAKMRKEVT